MDILLFIKLENFNLFEFESLSMKRKYFFGTLLPCIFNYLSNQVLGLWKQYVTKQHTYTTFINQKLHPAGYMQLDLHIKFN